MDNTIHNSFYILQGFLFVILLLPTLYIFVFAAAGLLYRQPPYPKSPAKRKIAVLIPGYKEDEVILEVAQDALMQDYPSEWYDVIIVADSFRPNTIELLNKLPIKVIEVRFEKSTKSKALNKAMEQLTVSYDIAVVLDADNLMAKDFLSKVNATFGKDYMAVQGHRAAKNVDTNLAILDAVSEEINNQIFRKGHRVMGLSSAIIGSGMAFRYDYFKNLMTTVTAVGGFDKEIELKMLKNRFKIEYLDDALVYDEKVQKAEVFSNQRRRWLSAQLHYFRQDFGSSLIALISHGNIDYFDKAMQFIQPPRILLLGAVTIFSSLFLVINWYLQAEIWTFVPWISVALLCVFSFMVSIPRQFYNKNTLIALASLPKGMILMLGSLLKIRGANKQFIHTKHGATKTITKI